MMGRDGSGNVLAPNLTLKLNPLLQNFAPDQRKDELRQVTFLILRNIPNLRQVYHFYCTLGHNRVQSTKSEMTRLQFWRFIKDSHIHHHGLSLPEMDRIVATCLEKGSVHQPTERLSLSDFLSSITILGYIIFKDKIKTNKRSNGKSRKDKPKSPAPPQGGRSPMQRSQSYVLSNCLQMLVNEHVMKHSGRVKGGFLSDPRRAINALAYMEGSWKVYRSLCDQPSREPTLVMRKLLIALKDFQIIGPRLSSEKFLKILASDNPNVCEAGVYNLEIEMSFLEYFEALVACAVTFVDKEMLKQPAYPSSAARPVRRFSTGPSSAGGGIGHSRPGSSYSRRTPSARSVSSQPSSIASIEEDDSRSSSEASTVQPSDGQGAAQNVEESMETTATNMEELNIADEMEEDVNDNRSSPASIGMSTIFADMEDDDEMAMASPRSRRSTPEVVTVEMEEREREFVTWSSQLHIFFTKHLFPAWQKNEMLRRETTRHRSRKLAL